MARRVGWGRCLVGVAGLSLVAVFAPAEASLQSSSREALPPSSGARPIPDGRWVGEVGRGSDRWVVELRTHADGPGLHTNAQVDLPTYWRSALPVRLEAGTGLWGTDSIPGLGRLSVHPVLAGLDVRVETGPAAGAVGVLRAMPQRRYTERHVSFESDGIRMSGRLLTPVDGESLPGVVVVPGAGNSSVDGNPEYRFWGHFLASRGFAVLLYDKRGSGGSEGHWRSVGFEPRADDVVHAFDLLADDPRVEPSRIAALSFSQGGWVTLLATERGARFSHLIQVSSPSVGPFEADLHPIERSVRAAGATDAQWERWRVLWELDVRARSREDGGAAWDSFAVAVERMNSTEGALHAPYVPGTRGSQNRLWYGRIAPFDPAPILNDLTTPVLWIYGSADTQSDIEANVEVLRTADPGLDTLHTVRIFDGAGHGIAIPLPSAPPEYLSPPELFETVMDRLTRMAECDVYGAGPFLGCAPR